jgi:hypothetical protein
MQDMRDFGITDNLQTRSRTILINSANGALGAPDAFNGWWDPKWGWGKLNGDRAFWDDYKSLVGTVDPTTPYADYYFTANAGEWHKFTLVWKRHMVNTTTEDLTQDLNLELYDMAGNKLDESKSTNNTVEQVKFQVNPSAKGTYRVRVTGPYLRRAESYVLAGRVALRTTP